MKIEVCFRINKGIRDALESLARSEYRTLDQQLEKIIMDYCAANNIVPVKSEEPKRVEEEEEYEEEYSEEETQESGTDDLYF